MECTILREFPFFAIQAKAHLGEVEAASWLLARPEDEPGSNSIGGPEVEDEDPGGGHWRRWDWRFLAPARSWPIWDLPKSGSADGQIPLRPSFLPVRLRGEAHSPHLWTRSCHPRRRESGLHGSSIDRPSPFAKVLGAAAAFKMMLCSHYLIV